MKLLLVVAIAWVGACAARRQAHHFEDSPENWERDSGPFENRGGERFGNKIHRGMFPPGDNSYETRWIVPPPNMKGPPYPLPLPLHTVPRPRYSAPQQEDQEWQDTPSLPPKEPPRPPSFPQRPRPPGPPSFPSPPRPPSFPQRPRPTGPPSFPSPPRPPSFPQRPRPTGPPSFPSPPKPPSFPQRPRPTGPPSFPSPPPTTAPLIRPPRPGCVPRPTPPPLQDEEEDAWDAQWQDEVAYGGHPSYDADDAPGAPDGEQPDDFEPRAPPFLYQQLFVPAGAFDENPQQRGDPLAGWGYHQIPQPPRGRLV
ncbi:hypothetical protein R5R35_009695 [Gryllus longicercus]|uniref:Accessory gland protein n=1 Tax=Gryllus longicercus TaxID=2509291 RepID=A0AAN9Z6D4_9ORTH